jgi:broad-specificity NMP kinase
MIISIEDSLTELYNSLKGMGYEVYKFSDNVVSEVVVYSGTKNHFSTLNNSAALNNNSAVFLIDGDNKEVSEVAGMIKNKTYSSLF